MTQIKATSPYRSEEDPPLESLLSETVARTLRTIRARMGVDSPIISHPVCPNTACHEILYDRVDMAGDRRTLESFTNCPACGLDWSPITGQTPLNFTRVPLVAELEHIFAYPGMEDDALNWRERRENNARSAGELYPDMRIYRDQLDGDHIGTLLDPDGNPADAPPIDGVSTLFVNLSIDWLNKRASPFAPSYSIGPILLQLANLPAKSRGRQALIMCNGMTPGEPSVRFLLLQMDPLINGALSGPKEPTKETLWKYMLPIVMELLQAWETPIKVRTPSHPNGRLFRIYLAAISCDRPAFNSLCGNPGHTSKSFICQRCDLNQADFAANQGKIDPRVQKR